MATGWTRVLLYSMRQDWPHMRWGQWTYDRVANRATNFRAGQWCALVLVKYPAGNSSYGLRRYKYTLHIRRARLLNSVFCQLNSFGRIGWAVLHDQCRRQWWLKIAKLQMCNVKPLTSTRNVLLFFCRAAWKCPRGWTAIILFESSCNTFQFTSSTTFWVWLDSSIILHVSLSCIPQRTRRNKRTNNDYHLSFSLLKACTLV